MALAQRLYEAGLITYMRTDSTTLSGQALNAARSQARELYGSEYVPDKPRLHDRKVKNAQEAHEAIRPVDMQRTPASLRGKVPDAELRLYELIWRRAVASQMANAVHEQLAITLAPEEAAAAGASRVSLCFADRLPGVEPRGVLHAVPPGLEGGLAVAALVLRLAPAEGVEHRRVVAEVGK